MANRSVELSIKLQNAKSISDLDVVLKEINKDLKEIDVNSEAFTTMSSLAKEADGQLKTVKDNLRGISDEKQLDSVAKLGAAFGSAMSVATVASSHFGKQTQESIQNAIRVATELNVVLNSIKPIMEGLRGSNIRAFKEFVSGFKQSAIGAKLFGTTTKAALTATGIGLFIVALATIVTYWDDISEAIGLSNKQLDIQISNENKLLKSVEDTNKAREDALDFEVRLAKARGEEAVDIAIRENRAAKEKVALLQDEIDAHNELLNIKNVNNKLTQEDLDKERELSAALVKRQQEAEIAQANEDKAIADNLKKLDEVAKKKADERKKAKADREKENDDILKAIDDAKAAEYKIEQDAEKNLRQLRIDNIASRRARETAQIQEDAKNKIAALTGTEQQIADQTVEIKKKEFKDLTNLTLEYYAEALKIQDAQREANDAKAAEALAKQKEDYQAQLDLISESLTVAGDGLTQIFDAISAGYERTLENVATKLELIDTRFQESVATVENYNAQLSDAEGARREAIIQGLKDEEKVQKKLVAERKKLQNEEIKAKNKQAKIQYANDVIQSAIQTAQAILVALSGAPPPFNAVLAGITAGLSAVQTGIVLSNTPKEIPLLASGGRTPMATGSPDSTGERPVGQYTLHENEWISPRWMVEHPVYGGVINQLESVRKKGFADGGYSTTPSIQPSLAELSLTPQSLEAAFKNVKIYTIVSEVKEGLMNAELVESNNSIG